MEELILSHANAANQQHADSIVSSIVNKINCNPAELESFKNIIFKHDLLNKYPGLVYKIYEDLEFLPSPSDKDELPEYVYRGANTSPAQLINAGGFTANGSTKSILRHKKETGSSIYVSTSKDLNIAIEHACQYPLKWVYKLDSANGICTTAFLAPINLHAMEKEVIFRYEIPFSQVKEVAVASGWGKLATEFYPLNEHLTLIEELIKLGLVRTK